MNKILLTSLLLTLCATFGYTKTATEMFAEFNKLPSWNDKVVYCTENKSDLASIWKEFKTTPAVTIPQAFKLNQADNNIMLLMKYYQFALKREGSDIDATVEQKICINAYSYLSNEELVWKNIKTSNYTYNGNAIPVYICAMVAVDIADIDTLYTFKSWFQTKSGATYAIKNIKKFRKLFLNTVAPVKAKAVCVEIENGLVLNDIAGIEQYQVLSKMLSSRIIDNKIIK